MDTAILNKWKGDMSLYRKMKILVIDDEPANVALLEDMLSVNGYERVKSITDSRRTLETCREFEPDLVLLDLIMPHLDGFAVLELLDAYRSEIYLPVIVLTADVSEETKLRSLHAGATDFLLKPFNETEVLLRITNILENRRLHSLLANRCAALEDAIRARDMELREARSER
jgi:DNA-binding response OmpR family regulator